MKMKISTSDLLDKISAEYNDEQQRPEDSFTVKEFAKNQTPPITKDKAHKALSKLMESGRLQRKKIGSEFYYYEQP